MWSHRSLPVGLVGDVLLFEFNSKIAQCYKSTEYEVQNTRLNDGQFAEEYGFGSRHTVVI